MEWFSSTTTITRVIALSRTEVAGRGLAHPAVSSTSSAATAPARLPFIPAVLAPR
jgi:hypothetical protein